MYRHINDSQPFKVTFNGHPLSDVVWADDETGYACIFCHDRDGQRIPDEHGPSGFECIELKGDVVITEVAQVDMEDKQPHIEWHMGYPVCMRQDIIVAGPTEWMAFERLAELIKKSLANRKNIQ